jgi:hypothetical protein
MEPIATTRRFTVAEYFTAASYLIEGTQFALCEFPLRAARSTNLHRSSRWRTNEKAARQQGDLFFFKGE